MHVHCTFRRHICVYIMCVVYRMQWSLELPPHLRVPPGADHPCPPPSSYATDRMCIIYIYGSTLYTVYSVQCALYSLLPNINYIQKTNINSKQKTHTNPLLSLFRSVSVLLFHSLPLYSYSLTVIALIHFLLN